MAKAYSLELEEKVVAYVKLSKMSVVNCFTCHHFCRTSTSFGIKNFPAFGVMLPIFITDSLLLSILIMGLSLSSTLYYLKEVKGIH